MNSRWAALALVWLSSSSFAQATHHLIADRAIVPLDAAGQGPPPLDSARWQPVAMPDVVTRPVAVLPDGPGRRWMAWYRVDWAGDGKATSAAVYVPRAIGQPVQVWRLVGTQWQPVFDNEADRREQWNRPLLVSLPPASVQPLTVAVGLPFADGRFHAMSSLWLGPLAELRERASWRLALHLVLPQAASLAMASLGLLSFAVWLRRRKELAYLYFAAASIVWPLRNLHHFIDLPRNPLVADWFWWMTGVSVSGVMLVMYLFAFRFDRRRFPKTERGFVFFVIVNGLATLPFWPYDSLVMQHAANLAAALFVTVLLGSLAWRSGSRELKVIVAALVVSLGFAVHDWLLLTLRISPESIYLLPYGSMLVIGSFLHAAMRRFAGAIDEVEATNNRLADKLAQREREIEASHRQLRRIESEQAVLIERQRLMRDMHDGVGSTLIATLRGVENGALSHEGVADMLRAAIEDLRIAIDSLEPIEHDLATLLATLRTRVGRRLDTAGLRLLWTMDDLPPLPWLDATQALQVLRLIQESLTNVIKHAGARTVGISARVSGGAVLVTINDDGRGFDPALSSPGRGIVNMQHRARLLGGRLEIKSAADQGTAVSLLLPLSSAA